MKKKRRVPTCGHPERKHHAKGLCRQCYNASPISRASRKSYRASPKGRAVDRRYLVSPKGRAVRRTPKAQARMAAEVQRYRATPKGVLTTWQHNVNRKLKKQTKRYIELGGDPTCLTI